MSNFVWQWPQIAWACFVGFGLVCAIAKDGEPRTGKHSLALSMLALCISATLLYFGGFFTEIRP